MVPLNNADLVVMMEAGYVFVGMQKYKEAREIFEGACVLVPESEVPLVALGSVYFAQEKFDQALRCYKKALQKNPDSAFAKAYYGESLFFKGKPQEAEKWLQEAVSSDEDGDSARFAQALLDAIAEGFVPPQQAASGGAAS